MQTVLVIDDEPNILLGFRRALRDDGLRVLTAETAEDGLRLAEEERPDVTLLDLCLPDGSGLDVFRRLREADPRALVIFITAHGTTETAIEATKEGAFDYLLKPLEVPRVKEAVEAALRVRHAMQTPAVLGPDRGRPGGGDAIIGRCPAMQAVYKAIGRVAPQDVSVLVLGESGTGKELVARAVYQHGRRADRLFLAVNCAAIPESLLESELFGHEQGAFTGADRRRVGRFEQCDGGTLFLDEIGELSPATQAKLLRVLQDGTFQPVGGSRTLRADVRIVAATNRDLAAMVMAGTFRTDLYYRLADFTIELPPLRDRAGDLPTLVGHHLRRMNAELGTDVDVVPDETMGLLEAYPWPGNIRELQNALRSALLHATGRVLLPDFLPGRLRGAAEAPPRTAADLGGDFRAALEDLLDRGEKDVYANMVRRLDRLVLDVLTERTGGNQVRMSRMLGITRNTLRAKLRAIEEPEPQPARSGD